MKAAVVGATGLGLSAHPKLGAAKGGVTKPAKLAPLVAFASPAAMLAPGKRTGPCRVGADRFMTDGNGESRISPEDRAVAMLDETERPQHRRKRLPVACRNNRRPASTFAGEWLGSRHDGTPSRRG